MPLIKESFARLSRSEGNCHRFIARWCVNRSDLVFLLVPSSLLI